MVKQRSSEKQSPKASRPYMPGYGVPRGSKGMLAWSWAEQRLKKSHNYWICTVRSDGRPHVMPIWGVWLDGAFLFSTGRDSRKAKNLSQRPQCALATERSDQAVIVEGTAEETPDIGLRRRVLRLIEKKYNFDMSSFEEDVLNLKEPIYVVRPATVFALDERRFPATATKWKF